MPALKFHRAFTLIELLATILVVLVLAMLFFPVVQGMMEAGDRATCSGNLRQIGSAFGLLLSDNGGRWPTYASNKDPGDTGVWYDKLRPYLGLDAKKGIGVTQPEVFKCPSNHTHQWDYNKLSYGYNIYLGDNTGLGGGADGASWSRVRSVGISRPSQVIVAADGDSTQDTYNSYLDGRWRGPGVIHKGGANILFADGHVEWRIQNETVYRPAGWTEDLMRAYGAFGRYAQ